MKKTYIMPDMEQIKVRLESIIASSMYFDPNANDPSAGENSDN